MNKTQTVLIVSTFLLLVLATVFIFFQPDFENNMQTTTTSESTTSSTTVDKTYSLVLIKATTTTSYPHRTTTVTKYGNTITERATKVYTGIEGLTITTTETIFETTYGSTITMTKIGETTTKTTTVTTTKVLKQPTKPQKLIGQEWKLDSLVNDGQEFTFSRDRNVTILFDTAGKVNGFGGCNRFTGEYKVLNEYEVFGHSNNIELQIGIEGNIFLAEILRTALGCLPNVIMESEYQYFSALEKISSFQVLAKNLKLINTDQKVAIQFEALTNPDNPNLISSAEAIDIILRFKEWENEDISSFGVFTEMRYLNVSMEDGEKWLDIYTVDPKTGEILSHQQNLSFKIPDPVIKLRGYYWYVSINTNPEALPMEVGLYSHSFWVNAFNSTIMHSKGPS